MKQSEESKKRMMDVVENNRKVPPHDSVDFKEYFIKVGYLAGMQDPEANGGLLEECEKFLVRLKNWTDGSVEFLEPNRMMGEIIEKLKAGRG